MRLLGSVVLAAILTLPIAARAQDRDQTPQPQKYRNVTWYRVERIALKAGKREDALKLIKQYYLPASKAAGTEKPVLYLEHQTGPWDLTIIWRLQGGPSELEWKESPDGLAWYRAFVKVAGGQQKAEEIMSKESSYTARETSSIALQEEAFSGGSR